MLIKQITAERAKQRQIAPSSSPYTLLLSVQSTQFAAGGKNLGNFLPRPDTIGHFHMKNFPSFRKEFN